VPPPRLASIIPGNRAAQSAVTMAGMPAPAPRPVAVFDLDGTLLRGDTTVEFIRGLILSSPARTITALLIVPLLSPFFFMPFTRRNAIAVLLWIATVGLAPSRLQALVEEFAAQHAAEGNRITVVLDRLRAHLAAGDRVIIATGCADWLATAACRALGLDTVEVVAARLRQGRTFVRPARECGMWNALPTSAGVMSFGLEKLRRLAAAGITFPVAYAYTDSATDLPLLLAATKRHVVEPAPRHLRRIRSKAGRECVVLRSPGGQPAAGRGS
jgi:phosphatidylglycerophosphatase C